MIEEKPGIDYAAQLATIERSIAETRKFAAEQTELSEETLKLGAERNKLTEEALKIARDRTLSPLIVLSSIVSGILGALGGVLGALATHYLRQARHGAQPTRQASSVAG